MVVGVVYPLYIRYIRLLIGSQHPIDPERQITEKIAPPQFSGHDVPSFLSVSPWLRTFPWLWQNSSFFSFKFLVCTITCQRSRICDTSVHFLMLGRLWNTICHQSIAPLGCSSDFIPYDHKPMHSEAMDPLCLAPRKCYIFSRRFCTHQPRTLLLIALGEKCSKRIGWTGRIAHRS